ncbi:MAG: ABC transporter substrate-binding protein [Nitrospirota bacterium]|nr:ABC transporter substrate-binding protein [Nitrospirota bacterium]
MKISKNMFTSLRKLILILMAALVVFSLGCVKKDEKEIKIGAVLPLTGDAAIAGINTREGMELAVSEINQSGLDGKKIRIVYEDTQADPRNAVSALNKLINVNHVSYVVDDSISSVTLALAPIAEKNKVVLLSTGSTAPKISQAGEYIFRIWNSDSLEGEELARYAVDKLKLKNIGVLYANNDYGLGLSEVFRSQLSERGLKPANVESFEQGSPEYRTQLAKLLSNKPEAIYLVGYSKDCVKIIQQAKEMRYKGIWLGTTVMLDGTVTDVIKKNNYELYYPVPFISDTLSTKNFKDKFLLKYKKAPPALADVGYDAVMLFKKAVEMGGGLDGESIGKSLMNIKKHDGASGLIEFDKNGDVHKPIEVKLLKH